MNHQITIDEEATLRILINYLREKGCYETLLSLLLESDLSLAQDFPKELIYLQRIVLQGRWEDTERYLRPILDNNAAITSKVNFILYRQRFLETMCWHGGGSQRWLLPPWKPTKSSSDIVNDEVELDDLVSQLNKLKALCTAQQFQSLCLFLSLDKLEDHPDYHSWTVCEGRIRCLEDLTLLVLAVSRLPPTNGASSVPSLLNVITIARRQALTLSPNPEHAARLPLLELIQAYGNVGDAVFHPKVTILKHSLGRPEVAKVVVPAGEEGVNHQSRLEPMNQTTASMHALELRATVPWPKAQAVNTGDTPSLISTNSKVSNEGPNSRSPPPKSSSSVSWTVELDDHSKVVPVPSAVRQRPTLSNGQPSNPNPPPAALSTPEPLLDNSSGKASIVSNKQLMAPAMERQPQDSVKSRSQAYELLFLPSCPLRCSTWIDSSADGSTHRIAVGSNNKSVHILRFNSKEIISKCSNGPAASCFDARTFVVEEDVLEDIHKGSVYAIDYSQKHGLLVTGSNDKYLRLSSIREDRSVIGHALKGHNGTVRSVKFSHFSGNMGGWLLSGGAGDFRPRLWDVEQETCVRILSEHPAVVHSLFWLGETLAVSGCEGGRIIGHDLRTANPAWSFSFREGMGVFAMTTVPCFPGILAAGLTGGDFALIDTVSASLVLESKAHESDVRSLCMIGSDRLLTSSYDTNGAIWQLESSGQSWNARMKMPLKHGHTDKILSIFNIPKANHVISTGADGKALLWTS